MPQLPCILIVDDEAAVRRVVRTVLERNGFQILEAADATEALAIYDQHQQEIRLVVSDVRMPGMDGNELARSIHHLCASQRILFATAYPGDVDTSVYRFETLAKPFTGKQLLAKIASQLAFTAAAG
jgi:CheY-like chemotaxis protein